MVKIEELKKEFNLTSFLAGYCNMPMSRITENTHLYCDLRLTEEDVKHDIINPIESILNIKIPEKDFSKIKTVKDLENYCHN